ncbi:glycosyltransferase family 39 protein [Mycena olivaceomarginata]|nr:glycosyltransferase family 39 protein [Mycena olivaceomarginata]
MSASVRARRPASPPPGASHGPPTSQRFPHARQDHLDADVRRAAASKGLAPGRGKVYPLGGLNISSGEWKLLVVILIVASAVRLFRLSKPTSVVFDEVHFGKFASKYIKTQYFVDVHPPLAKLLITLAAFIFGYDGNFDFKDIGKPYDDVPYVAMRLVPALFGIATIPLSYLTLRGLDCRATTALLASLFLTFENAIDKHEPFTESWWFWLVMSGLSLGAVFSCKWVGLFTIATVGLSTVNQLWVLLGDLRVSPRVWLRHFVARAICLIVIPAVFYMGMFQIHFMILGSSGDGDGFMSSEFQHTLGGRGMQDTFADVAVDSQITIRHLNTQGGYLHSHAHNFPGGSKQQQITLYPHRDQNNDWRIYNATWEDVNPNTGLIYITDKMRVKIEHISTFKRLHSHDVRPPVSDVDFQNEVSAYGMAGFEGDANDDWWVEIVKLPEWGFEQQEVTCNKNAVMANSLWYVETAMHPDLPADAPKVNYKLPGFMAKFLELQQVMWTTNAGLTDRHTFDSRPDSWPRLRRGINFWVKDHTQIYLIGNPMVWWLSSLAVFGYIARGYRDFDNSKVVKYDSVCGFLFLGWFLHYFPFYLMGRQLFLHHYLPALYFGVLLLSSVFDLLTSSLRPRVRLQIAGVLIILAVWNFAYFSPLAYGNQWTRGKCNSAKWLKTWDFSWYYGEYAGVAAPTPHAEPAAVGQGAPEGEAKAEHTSAFVVKPEPGHDIFAGERQDPRSKARQPPPVVDEDAIIDSVVQQVTTATDAAEAESESAAASSSDAASSASAAASASSVESESASSLEVAPDASSLPPAAKQAGPVGEAEAEAAKVAAELYPDAAEK